MPGWRKPAAGSGSFHFMLESKAESRDESAKVELRILN